MKPIYNLQYKVSVLFGRLILFLLGNYGATHYIIQAIDNPRFIAKELVKYSHWQKDLAEDHVRADVMDQFRYEVNNSAITSLI